MGQIEYQKLVKEEQDLLEKLHQVRIKIKRADRGVVKEKIKRWGFKESELFTQPKN